MSNATLYATLRLKRRPVSNAIICYKLRVAYAEPVHKYALHEEDISDLASMTDIEHAITLLQQRFKCANVLLDAADNVMTRIAKNS